MPIQRIIAVALTSAALALPAAIGAATAQDALPAQGMQAPQVDPGADGTAASYSDDTLRSFATAFLEVDALNRNYSEQLQAAATPEAQAEIQEQASTDMVEAVAATDGISVNEYTEIMQAAQASPELAQRLTAFIGEASQQQ
jgi:hypothetical protein